MNQLKIKSKLWSFTLLELLYVMGIIGLIMPAMFALYNFMIKWNREISARQSAIQQWYEFFERLNILFQDYRIDYEEYYNRQMVWCTPSWWMGSSFRWEVGSGWYCTNFTTYWNWSSTNRREWSDAFKPWYHDLYYCSSEASQNPSWKSKIVRDNYCGTVWTVQSYGQYATLFTDVKWWMSDKVWDLDDENLWYLLNNTVRAIMDSDNIQELYLISQDWKNRLYFRRKLANSDGDFTQYKIQMLRLKWFDAWRLHNFDIINTGNIENRWRYDWTIDTWACDYSMWFEPKQEHKISANSVWWAYSGYYIPQDSDDCWIDMTYWVTNVVARNISVSPTWNPNLYWAEQDRQINDYIKIFLINGVYVPSYWATMSASMSDFVVPLQTTINMEWFYR